MSCPRCRRREIEQQGSNEMLMSAIAWLGMLGQLREAVILGDQERARRLARQPITYPQPYPEENPEENP